MLKGALHIHSNISPDSDLSREYLRKIFKEAGYSFVLLTEHAEDLNKQTFEVFKEECDELSDEAFLMIPGLEIKWKEKVHFLAYGAKEYMENENTLSLKDTINAIRENTRCDFLGWGHFNHPAKLNGSLSWAVAFVDGVEVSNPPYHGWIFPDFAGLLLLNRMRRIDSAVVAISGLDMHGKERLDRAYYLIPGLNRVVREDIFDFLKQGKFILKNGYLSLNQGPYGPVFLMSSFIAGLSVGYFRRARNKVVKQLKSKISWNRSKF